MSQIIYIIGIICGTILMTIPSETVREFHIIKFFWISIIFIFIIEIKKNKKIEFIFCINMADRELVELPQIGGIYKHYKGNLYRVICIARNTETMMLSVVYECLYANPISKNWYRPIEIFMDTIIIAGIHQRRFVLKTSDDIICETNKQLREFIENNGHYLNEVERDNDLNKLIKLINDTFITIEQNNRTTTHCDFNTIIDKCDYVLKRKYHNSEELESAMMCIIEMIEEVIALTQFVKN